jgi:hypothetical protein
VVTWDFSKTILVRKARRLVTTHAAQRCYAGRRVYVRLEKDRHGYSSPHRGARSANRISPQQHVWLARITLLGADGLLLRNSLEAAANVWGGTEVGPDYQPRLLFILMILLDGPMARPSRRPLWRAATV